MQRKYSYILLMTCILVTSCASDAEKEAKQPERSVNDLYGEARGFLAEKDYSKAAESFDEVEKQHPFSEWAARSQVMAAYANYKAQKYDDAVLALERFMDMYPSNESMDYVYYLTALCYYEQISDVGRDQGVTRKAQKALTDVVRRFPDSPYARDAQLKLDLTNDHLAGKEMMVGRYYLGNKEYLAAANRFRAVVEEFSTTSHTPEALHRLVEVYLLLGVREEAERYAAVLGHNFPESEWYERSYALLRGDAKAKPEEETKWWQMW